MAERENMFVKNKKEDRRRQFIEENMDVAEQVMSTSPTNILRNEDQILETEEKVEDQENIDNALPKNNAEEPKENNIIPFKIVPHPIEKIKKKGRNYYIEEAMDTLAIILSKKMGLSKSEFINLFLKSAVLTNADILEIAKNDEEIQNLLEKLKK